MEYNYFDGFYDVFIDDLKKELSVIAPFGDFSFDKVNGLKEKTGYNVLFYSANVKEYNDYNFSEVKDIFTYSIKEEAGKVYFVAFKKDGSEETIPFDIISMPSKSYDEINAKIAELDKKIEENEIEIIKNQVYIENINKEIDNLNISNHFEEAKESFVASEGTEGKILYVEAYVPKDKENEVKSLLDNKKIAYIMEDPSRNDKVPVELKNNKYSGAYELITKLFQLPNYFEIDLTPMIAVFYPLFFAYCFGDSGYTDACGGSSFSESDQLRQAGGGSGRGADYGGCGPALYPGPTGGRGAEGQRYSASDQPGTGPTGQHSGRLYEPGAGGRQN